MERRAARGGGVPPPGKNQLTSLPDAKPCTSTIGSPSPSSRKAISTPSCANRGMPDHKRSARQGVKRCRPTDGRPSGLSLPLNVHGNASQEAAAVLSAARLKARRLADQLEIVFDNGGPRRPLS